MNSGAEQKNASQTLRTHRESSKLLRLLTLASLLIGAFPCVAQAYGTPPPHPETTEEKVRRLAQAVAQAQAQMSAYQMQLLEMQRQLATLQQQLAAEKGGHPAAPAAEAGTPPAEAIAGNTSSTTTALDDIRERQSMDESQIATHEQTKVETESKYPLKITGLLLFNTFINTRQVDIPEDPTYAVDGSGSTGMSLRQTILGFDARGPQLFGATSDADVRVDFFANGSISNYSANGLLRLRTAHGNLNWSHTRAFIALDRSLIAPYTPSSLVAVGEPPLAWSGNLWSWISQIGVSETVPFAHSQLKLEAGLLDPPPPPNLSGPVTNPPTASPSERSRWPGTNARLSYSLGEHGAGPTFGIGGYFSPHRLTNGDRYDSWAGTLDLRVPAGPHFELLANAFRGQGLGGLGAGGYLDYVYKYTPTGKQIEGLNDVGGWAQLKFKPQERLEFNAAYGIDNPFASDIRMSMDADSSAYAGLARNRAAFGNVIYSPSSYLLFSIEYRKLWTSYFPNSRYSSDVIGLGAGYRF